MIKRFLAIILAVFLIIAMVGCKKKGESGGNYVATIKIGYYEAGYGTEFMDYWTEEYNKAHPDEQIRFVIDPNVGAATIGNSLENSASLNDIYLSLATNWSGWARSGWIEPLDDIGEMINEDGVKFDDAYRNKVDRNYGYLDDHRYVLQQTGGGMGNGFIYSAKLFREKGWTVPETVDDLYDLVDTINADPVNNDSNPDNDIAPFAWGGQVMGYWNTVIGLWWGQFEGPEYFENFYKNPSPENYANREGLKKALQIFEKLICTGEGVPQNSLPGAMGKNHLLLQKDFVQYKAAMISGYYGIINETKEYIDPDCDLKVFLPTVDGAKTDDDGNPYILALSDAAQCDFMFIAKASKVKEYAKKFLVWISTKKMSSAYLRYTGSVSPFKYNKEDITDVNPLIKSLLEMSEKPGFVVVDTSSEHPITRIGKITMWPMGEPYTDMVLNNKSAASVLRSQATYVSQNWSDWEWLAGMKE